MVITRTKLVFGSTETRSGNNNNNDDVVVVVVGGNCGDNDDDSFRPRLKMVATNKSTVVKFGLNLKLLK